MKAEMEEDLPTPLNSYGSEGQRIPVPQQLRNEVFIKLHSEHWRLNPSTSIVERNKLKTPSESWNDSLSRYNADTIDEYRRNSDGFGNYALIPTTLSVIDADSSSELEKYGLISTLPKTFRVKSGRMSGDGMHIYLNITDIPNDKKVKITFADNLGDIRFAGHNSYVVGPYSMHPSGRRYMPENVNAAVGKIEYEDLMEIISKIPRCKNTLSSPGLFTERVQKVIEGRKYTGSNVMIELREWWSQRQDIASMIPGNYQKYGNRWLSPNSTSGSPGITIIHYGGTDKIWCWHDNDDLFSNMHPTNPFDLLVFRCNGTVKEADKIVIKEAKKYNYPLYLKWATRNAEWRMNRRESANGVSA